MLECLYTYEKKNNRKFDCWGVDIQCAIANKWLYLSRCWICLTWSIVFVTSSDLKDMYFMSKNFKQNKMKLTQNQIKERNKQVFFCSIEINDTKFKLLEYRIINKWFLSYRHYSWHVLNELLIFPQIYLFENKGETQSHCSSIEKKIAGNYSLVVSSFCI